MSFINKPKVAHPSLPTNALGMTRRQYEGSHVDALRRLRARLDHRRDHRGVLGARYAARTTGEALRHRLLLEDHRLFRERRARLQFGPRTHALDRERRERRQSRADLHRHIRRRRFPVDRLGPAGARDPAQREHALSDREQRRLRSHQGSVLGLGGHRHQGEEGRGESDSAHRSGAARAVARRDVRRARLFRRQGAARAR